MSPSKAIRVFCLQCMGTSPAVAECRSKICSLVDYRFGRGQGRVKKRVLSDYCLHCVGGVRAEAVNCTDPNCSFYPYRPGQRPYAGLKGRSAEEMKKVRFTLEKKAV